LYASLFPLHKEEGWTLQLVKITLQLGHFCITILAWVWWHSLDLSS